jgi:hypothetical protein
MLTFAILMHILDAIVIVVYCQLITLDNLMLVVNTVMMPVCYCPYILAYAVLILILDAIRMPVCLDIHLGPRCRNARPGRHCNAGVPSSICTHLWPL